jgi:hypothetical protein
MNEGFSQGGPSRQKENPPQLKLEIVQNMIQKEVGDKLAEIDSKKAGTFA